LALPLGSAAWLAKNDKGIAGQARNDKVSGGRTGRFLTAFGMTLYRIIWGWEKAAAKPLLFPIPPSSANARHSWRAKRQSRSRLKGEIS